MVLGRHDLHRAYLITPEEIAASERDYIALGHWDVPHDMSAGTVTAAYSGSASRYRVCALVTLTDDDAGRRVDVERLDLGPADEARGAEPAEPATGRIRPGTRNTSAQNDARPDPAGGPAHLGGDRPGNRSTSRPDRRGGRGGGGRRRASGVRTGRGGRGRVRWGGR